MSFLRNCFSGSERLWKAFWLGLLLVVVVLFLVSFLVGFLSSILTVNISEAIGLIIVYIFKVWWWISVWQCARNSSMSFWMYAARVIVILSILGALGITLLGIKIPVVDSVIGSRPL